MNEKREKVSPRFRRSKKKPRSKFGRMIRSQRIRLGMSQDELAKKLGVSRQYISLLELGRGVNLANSPASFAKIAEALRLSVEELLRVRSKRKLKTPKPTKFVGSILARKRMEINWTQEHLSEISGVPAWLISAVERGTFNIDTESLRKLLEALRP